MERFWARAMALAAILLGGATPPAQAADSIKVGEYLRPGQYLRSASGAFFASIRGDGKFVVVKGFDESDHYGELWGTGAGRGSSRGFFAVLQTDGNFCTYAGKNREDRDYEIFCSMTRPPGSGEYFLVLQNDGNLAVYRGRPGAVGGVVWHADKTEKVTWPVKPTGKRIVKVKQTSSERVNSARGVVAFRSLAPNTSHSEIALDYKGATQKWDFMPDTTVRAANGRGGCWVLSQGENVDFEKCGGGSKAQMGWFYQASDQTLRRKDRKGCVKVDGHDLMFNDRTGARSQECAKWEFQ
jgi:hypothetical protein